MTPPARKAALKARFHDSSSPGLGPHASRVVRAFEYTAICEYERSEAERGKGRRESGRKGVKENWRENWRERGREGVSTWT
jgi:hypothetical protein